jgi:hypothetical protein
VSGDTQKIAAGLQFATVGSTGTASTGKHNHLRGLLQGNMSRNEPDKWGIIEPSTIFTNMGIKADYKNIDTELTGLPKGTSYNDPRVLQDILNYGRTFDRQKYVGDHKELFTPRVRNVPDVGVVPTHVFDISTMSYQPVKHYPGCAIGEILSTFNFNF